MGDILGVLMTFLLTILKQLYAVLDTWEYIEESGIRAIVWDSIARDLLVGAISIPIGFKVWAIFYAL